MLQLPHDEMGHRLRREEVAERSDGRQAEMFATVLGGGSPTAAAVPYAARRGLTTSWTSQSSKCRSPIS